MANTCDGAYTSHPEVYARADILISSPMTGIIASQWTIQTRKLITMLLVLTDIGQERVVFNVAQVRSMRHIEAL